MKKNISCKSNKATFSGEEKEVVEKWNYFEDKKYIFTPSSLIS